MAEIISLNYGYLGDLSNAHHDGQTQQIDDAVAGFETENATLLARAAALHQTRVREDEVWLKSQVDPNVKNLEAADKRQDGYIACAHGIINAYATLPEQEAQKQDAMACKQVFRDFKFSTHDSYGAEADKILQMGQNLQPYQTFLTTIGAWQWYTKAAQQATQVRQLLAQRAQAKGEFVKGEMKTARRQTDLAVRDLYQTLNAMQELMPTAELTALCTQLKGFELYAKQYYLSKGKDEEESDVTPVEPETAEGKQAE